MSDDDPRPPSQSPSPPEPPAPPPPAPTLPSPRRRGRKRAEITPQIREEIIRLKDFYGARRIARRVGLSRKLVRRVLEEAGCLTAPSPTSAPAGMTASRASRLDPFRERIVTLVKKDLTATRILREIRDLGFPGGRTILAEHIRKLRMELGLLPQTSVKRRFETGLGEEMQIDWSPFIVSIAGRPTPVHALGCLLCACRKLYLRFFRDERQSTLLEGLACAFEYFEGVARRIVLDNMATAVLGRILPGRKPLWHPRFLDFVSHYGCEPFACAVGDPDRKGKEEKTFRHVWDDLLKGSEFASWEDLDERRALWLDGTPGVGNLRVHGTTREVPNQAFEAERPFLIALPERRFPVHEDGVRLVDTDSTLSIDGTRFTVPSGLADRVVAVRLYAEHFEVLDPHGRVAFSRRYARDAEKGKLVRDDTHYAALPRRPRDGAGGGRRLDEAFLRRFPGLQPLVEGLRRRMKTLCPVHIRALVRLADRYGEAAFLAAASHAQSYRRFDASAVGRILERDAKPLPDVDPIPPLGGIGPVVLGEVEPASLDGYAHFDGAPPAAAPAARPSKAEPDAEAIAAAANTATRKGDDDGA